MCIHGPRAYYSPGSVCLRNLFRAITIALTMGLREFIRDSDVLPCPNIYGASICTGEARSVFYASKASWRYFYAMTI